MSRYEDKLKRVGVTVETIRRIRAADRFEEVRLVSDDGDIGYAVFMRTDRGEIRSYVEIRSITVADELASAGLIGAAMKARLLLEGASGPSPSCASFAR